MYLTYKDAKVIAIFRNKKKAQKFAEQHGLKVEQRHYYAVQEFVYKIYLWMKKKNKKKYNKMAQRYKRLGEKLKNFKKM